MRKKSKVIKALAVALAFCLTMGIAQKTVMASSGYTSFPYTFNGGTAIPSSASHITQTVDVYGSGSEYAYAECTKYTYSGSEKPILLIISASSDFPTSSIGFTSTATDQKMKYTYAIPLKTSIVTFKGTVNYSSTVSFTIQAGVEG